MVTTVARQDETGRTIYVDAPWHDRPQVEAVPEPHPHLQPNRWRFHFPWVKTAVSAPTYNGELLLANRTDHTWLVWHNYHGLGLLDPGDERHVRLARVGTISARKLVADADSEYLLLSLTPDLLGVEIVDVAPGEGFYTLRAMDTHGAMLETLPDSTKIEELGLSSKTTRALRHIGVATAGQLRQADLGALWDTRNGPAAYAELVETLFLHGTRHGD
jgi:hypothetical protein